VTPNFAPEPHAIHGVGWKRPWAIAEVAHTHCVLALHHQADTCWPWSFEATQSFKLKDGKLEMKLSATNLAEEPVPLAFGHHPYFDQEGASLSFNAATVFLSGDDALPTEAIPPADQFNFSDANAVEGRAIDHCFAGWDGKASISWADRPHALAITTDMAAAVVYVPMGGAAFCFEPVPHINNALNRPGEAPSMPILQPGESLSWTIVFTAVPA
jgi:aldose 1-epimerase